MDRPEDIRAFADQLRSLLPDDVSPDLVFAITPPTITEILYAVADYYGIKVHIIRDRAIRGHSICWARHVVCYFARSMTRCSHKQIATRLGGWDLTISHYGRERVIRTSKINELARDDLDILRLRITDTVLNRCEGVTCH